MKNTQTRNKIKGNSSMGHKNYTSSARLARSLVVCAALVAAVGSIVSALRPTPVSAACSSGCVASMSASPSSGTYNPGATITVSVVVNSAGQSINAVQADFAYTSSHLEYVGGSASGVNGWTAYVTNVGGGSGSVVVGRTSGAATSGAVISMQFKALSSAGTASISFSGSSSVVSSSTNQDILNSTSGASYSVVDPTPPPSTPPTQQTTQPPAQPGPTPSSGTNKKPAPSPASQPSTPAAQTPTETPTNDTETPKTTSTDQPAAETKTPQSTQKQSNPWVMAGLIAGGVVVLGGAGAGAMLYLRRRGVPVKTGTVPTSTFITGPATHVDMPPVNPGENPPTENRDDSNGPFGNPH